MDKIVIIGANEFQRKLVKRANELGYETHVIAWEEGAVAKEISAYFYNISIVNKAEILKLVKDIKPLGICSIASDLAMPTVNYVANQLGLVGNDLNCTKITTDKFEMRKVLTDNGLSCPEYKLVENFNELQLCNLKFPLITKPIDRSGSRGVFKVTDVQELKNAIEKSKEVSFSKHILVEEFIEGKEYSVEIISQFGEHHFLQITEKFTTGAPNFIEKGHLSPARITEELKISIIETVEKSLTALKVKNGPSHSEVKITAEGKIKIIEIAGRMGGDFIGSDMVYISTGYDFLKEAINVAVNKKIDLERKNKESNALVGFIFCQKDKERFIQVKKKYPEIVEEYSIKENFNQVQDSSSRNGYYILKIDDRKKLKDIVEILDMEALNDPL